MAENTTEQKPKRTRKPKAIVAPTVVTPPEEVAQIATFKEIAPTKAAIKPEDAPKVPEEIKPEVVPPVEPDEPSDEPEKPTYPIKPEDAPKVPEEVAPKSEITTTEKLPEEVEEVVAEKVISQNLAPKESKVVLKKLNPNLEDGKSKWAVAIVKGTELHVFFRGSLGKAHKRAENCCLLHGFDPKTIQLIRK